MEQTGQVVRTFSFFPNAHNVNEYQAALAKGSCAAWITFCILRTPEYMEDSWTVVKRAGSLRPSEGTTQRQMTPLRQLPLCVCASLIASLMDNNIEDKIYTNNC